MTGIPLPPPSGLTQPFWDAARDGRLIVPRCNACGRRFFRPEVACTHCFATDWDWVESPGLGVLYSFTTIWRAPTPGFPSPTVMAVIDLDDGWTMFSTLEGLDPEAVRIGLRVSVVFDAVTPDRTLPRFVSTASVRA